MSQRELFQARGECLSSTADYFIILFCMMELLLLDSKLLSKIVLYPSFALFVFKAPAGPRPYPRSASVQDADLQKSLSLVTKLICILANHILASTATLASSR